MKTKMSKLLAPSHLRVNLLAFAYNVDENAAFSWWDHSQDNDCYQTEYQIVITKRAVQLLNRDYQINTGWVQSSKNTAVKIPQLEGHLVENEVYYWQVRIKDNFGNISDYSQPEKFITTQYLKKPIYGIWSPNIHKKDEELVHLGNVAFVRSPKFSLNTHEIDSAIITAFSRGSELEFVQGFELRINGEGAVIGSARPQAYYGGGEETAIYYNRYDVTPFIKNGPNAIAAIIGGDSPRRAFFCQLEVYKIDGSKEIVQFSNNNWKALDGSSAFGDYGVKIRSLYFGMPSENIDMNFYPTGWDQAEFDDSTWPNATISEAEMVNNEEILVPYRSENTLRKLVTNPSKKIMRLDDEHFILDLGKEIIGSLKVDIESPINQRVTILMGEQLDDKGHVRHHMASGPDYVENWKLKQGGNRFTTFQMKNFRYVEILGFKGNLTVDAIQGWAIEQLFDESEGSFTSDNSLLNREYELSKYTIKATNQDVFVDSQARERRPYEGDLLVNGLTSYAVSSQYSLTRHSIDYCIDNPTWPEDYKLFNVEMAWMDYLYTGDATLLETRYDDLRVKFNRGKGKDSFDGASSDFVGTLRNGHGIDNFNDRVGLVTNDGLVDWPIRERDGYVSGEYNTPFNAIFFGNYQIMSKIAAATGHQDDVVFFEKRAAEIKTQMINRLYDSQSGKFYDSLKKDLSVNPHTSHHASAYALCYGVYEDEEMAARLSEYVANDGEFIGSVYFIYFMLKGLVDSGHADKAVDLLVNSNNQENAKTFAAILDNLHATIAPEAWSNYYKPNLTLSHPWGATPGLVIIQGVLGITPLTPGFNDFKIKVRPGTVNMLKAVVPTTKGIIRVLYNDESVVTIIVDVPMNTTAHLILPVKSADIQCDGVIQQSSVKELIIKSGRHKIVYSK